MSNGATDHFVSIPGSPDKKVTRAEMLAAFRTLVAKPALLATTIAVASDANAAAEALAAVFGVDSDLALIFLDQSFKHLLPGTIARY